MLTGLVFGVDPGTHHFGVSGVERQPNGTFRVHFAETISAPRDHSVFHRLEFIFFRLREWIEKFQPHTLAMEDAFFAKNPQSAFYLGLARGMALTSAFGKNIQFAQYTPKQVKLAVTGHGGADKLQVKKIVEWTLRSHIEGLDTSDAIAVALCHFLIRPHLDLQAGKLFTRPSQP